eukprot:CAMPEP_0170621800 /NCGR_PEP_ID=MMETSP0224-20130122/28790_1 /TAXON_ID=285029 /ORGANISM="Togula jolla, Strain CCCM 725" /LENGTH=58 /DNA_ID=CAMNT_0010948075 /DNA_START=54 /DNA_END=226 /DNA_ORIENTATION=-
MCARGSLTLLSLLCGTICSLEVAALEVDASQAPPEYLLFIGVSVAPGSVQQRAEVRNS